MESQQITSSNSSMKASLAISRLSSHQLTLSLLALTQFISMVCILNLVQCSRTVASENLHSLEIYLQSSRYQYNSTNSLLRLGILLNLFFQYSNGILAWRSSRIISNSDGLSIV